MRVVTIDGPAGAGKSTVATWLAGRLGWRLLDTGAMYRAVALAALRAGAELRSDSALGTVAERVDVALPHGRVLLDGEDVTTAVRSRDVTRAVRFVADSPRVRARLVQLQRAVAADNDLVTEGRDQGTIVFPDAPCKFFLTADPRERARRRHAELAAKGESMTLEGVFRDQTERDALDEARAIAPLRPAPDATVVDTTGLELDQVVDQLERRVRQCLGLEPARSSSDLTSEGARP
jgi:cytidylate kinase